MVYVNAGRLLDEGHGNWLRCYVWQQVSRPCSKDSAMVGNQSDLSNQQIDECLHWLVHRARARTHNNREYCTFAAGDVHAFLGEDIKLPEWFEQAVRPIAQDFKEYTTAMFPQALDGRVVASPQDYPLSDDQLRQLLETSSNPIALPLRKALDEFADGLAKVVRLHTLREILLNSDGSLADRSSRRIRIALAWHRWYLDANFADDTFTVLTLLADILADTVQGSHLFDFLRIHCLPTNTRQRADGLAGQAWHDHRQSINMTTPAMYKPPLKTGGKNPRVAVYSRYERDAAVQFFREHYLPSPATISASGG
jgi:hypothetical protein